MLDETVSKVEKALIEMKKNFYGFEVDNGKTDILSGTMDAYASVISNNLNIVMKVLTSLTLVLSIPTIISGLWGMNIVGLPFSDSPYGFIIVIRNNSYHFYYCMVYYAKKKYVLNYIL